jgi:hypothetical protein
MSKIRHLVALAHLSGAPTENVLTRGEFKGNQNLLYLFVLSLRNGMLGFPLLFSGDVWIFGPVAQNRFHTRAAALLKMAKTTSDPKVAAGLLHIAADLKDQAGELPPSLSPKAPDVQEG